MENDDQSRHDLFVLLEAALGREVAVKLMEQLPPVGWAELATARDLDQVEARMGARIDQVEARMGARIDQVEARMGARIDQVEARVGEVEARLGARMDQVEARLAVAVSDLRAEFHRDIAATTRTLVFAQFGAVATAVGLVFAAVRL